MDISSFRLAWYRMWRSDQWSHRNWQAPIWWKPSPIRDLMRA